MFIENLKRILILVSIRLVFLGLFKILIIKIKYIFTNTNYLKNLATSFYYITISSNNKIILK